MIKTSITAYRRSYDDESNSHRRVFARMKWKPIVAACATLSDNHTNVHACPCFSMSDLNRITMDNVEPRRSCSATHGWSLWRKPIHTLDEHHGFGYSVYIGAGNIPSSCLMEGDMMLEISIQEAAACEELIQQRCRDLGLIQ